MTEAQPPIGQTHDLHSGRHHVASSVIPSPTTGHFVVTVWAHTRLEKAAGSHSEPGRPQVPPARYYVQWRVVHPLHNIPALAAPPTT